MWELPKNPNNNFFNLHFVIMSNAAWGVVGCCFVEWTEYGIVMPYKLLWNSEEVERSYVEPYMRMANHYLQGVYWYDYVDRSLYDSTNSVWVRGTRPASDELSVYFIDYLYDNRLRYDWYNMWDEMDGWDTSTRSNQANDEKGLLFLDMGLYMVDHGKKETLGDLEIYTMNWDKMNQRLRRMIGESSIVVPPDYTEIPEDVPTQADYEAEYLAAQEELAARYLELWDFYEFLAVGYFKVHLTQLSTRDADLIKKYVREACKPEVSSNARINGKYDTDGQIDKFYDWMTGQSYLAEQSASWEMGELLRTDYWNNVGHYTIENTQVADAINTQVYQEFGYGSLILQVEDSALVPNQQTVSAQTCQNIFIVIRDILAFGRTDYKSDMSQDTLRSIALYVHNSFLVERNTIFVYNDTFKRFYYVKGDRPITAAVSFSDFYEMIDQYRMNRLAYHATFMGVATTAMALAFKVFRARYMAAKRTYFGTVMGNLYQQVKP